MTAMTAVYPSVCLLSDCLIFLWKFIFVSKWVKLAQNDQKSRVFLVFGVKWKFILLALCLHKSNIYENCSSWVAYEIAGFLNQLYIKKKKWWINLILAWSYRFKKHGGFFVNLGMVKRALIQPDFRI